MTQTKTDISKPKLDLQFKATADRYFITGVANILAWASVSGMGKEINLLVNKLNEHLKSVYDADKKLLESAQISNEERAEHEAFLDGTGSDSNSSNNS